MRAEPAVGVDRAGPAVAETDVIELREGEEEVSRELAEGLRPVFVPGVDSATVVVDRVVPTPQNPVVGGQAVVVELVGGIADTLPGTPADTVELVVRQRLSGHRVVVNRDRVKSIAAEQAGKDIGGQHYLPSGDGPGRGDDLDCAGVAVDHSGNRVLVNPDAFLRTGPCQFDHQSGGIDNRAVRIQQPCPVGRRVDLGADRIPVQKPAFTAERGSVKLVP